MRSKYARLRNTIIATTLCFAILPTLLVGIFIPLQFTDLYRSKALREAENVARSKGNTIDIFFEERISQLKTLAETQSYETLTSPAKLAELLRIMKSNSQSYVDLGIIDMEGRHVAYAGAYDVLDANYKYEPWFAETLRRGIFVSDVFMGFRKFPHIIIAVLHDDGKRSWVLRATVDSAVFNSIVRLSQLSADGDAFVMNRSGFLQTDSLHSGTVMQRVQLTLPPRGVQTGEMIFNGKERLISMVPLQEVPWLLVVSEDPRAYLTILERARFITAAGVGVALIALIFCIWLTTRLMIGRLIESDRQKAAYDASLVQSSKMAALGKMAAGVAHEINNPLMLIRENAGWIGDLLTEEDPKAIRHFDDIAKAAGRIEQHVTRASTITHGLLGFARRVEPKAESLPLEPIVAQAVAFLQNEATYRNIKLIKNFHDNGLRISTDTGQLQQVILNIIDNALDAVQKDGEILIETSYVEGNAVIRIKDSGPGIPADMINQIFDPFFTTKKQGEGTGLGLSICYSIMQSLGGSITVENRAEGGVEFVVSLPVETVA